MKLSLAGWSLNRMFRRAENPLKLIDFAKFTKDNFGIDAIELNSPFFESRDAVYLDKLNKAASSAGVKMLNIAVDEKGDLASTNEAERAEAIANYSRWAAVAKTLGCSAIRANSGGGKATDKAAAVVACTESFKKLAEEGKKQGITIVMENHWGVSENPDVMVQIIEAVNKVHGKGAMGSLPDFGNWPEGVDRFAALKKIMPFAKAVHAKVNDIDENLNHPRYDLAQCVQIARDGGYNGYLGIEYEGKDADEVTSVKRAVKKLKTLI